MSKRNSNEETIEDVIKKLIKSYGMSKNHDSYQAENAFKKVMGAPIAKYTKEIYIKNKRMYVKLTSSVIREELSMGKSKIVNMVNEEIGRVVILDIVFV